jgi:hypothetical protein
MLAYYISTDFAVFEAKPKCLAIVLSIRGKVLDLYIEANKLFSRVLSI